MKRREGVWPGLPFDMRGLYRDAKHLVIDDEGAHVGCQSGLRPRDTPLGLILFLVSTRLPIP